MASLFGHAAAGLAISNVFRLKSNFTTPMLVVGIVLSLLPDADMLGFYLGVPYESMWGHRGISHSILLAVLIAIILAFFMGKSKKQVGALTLFFFLSMFTHSLLDALTTGGEGVAFFAPFNNTRYFLPWQVIKVSPFGIDNFMSARGLLVLKSEALWIGIPLLLSYLLLKIFKKQST